MQKGTRREKWNAVEEEGLTTVPLKDLAVTNNIKDKRRRLCIYASDVMKNKKKKKGIRTCDT